MNSETKYGTDKYEAIRALQELDMNRVSDTDMFPRPIFTVEDEQHELPCFLRPQI
jgi:hypothetical protein